MFAGLQSTQGPQSYQDGLAHLESHMIPPWRTALHSLVFVLVGLIIAGVTMWVELNLLIVVGTALFFAGHFFAAKKRLPIGWIAVRLFFGKRSAEWSPVYAESANWGHWTLWPFVSLQPINMQGRALDLPLVVIIVGGKHGRPVAITVDASIVWSVWHPWRILSYGESIMVTALQELALSTIRDWGAGKSPEQVLSDRDGLKRGLQNALRQKIDEESDIWGIHVSRILVRNILIQSPKVLDSFESITSEKARVDAVQHIVESTKRLADELELDMKDAVIFSALQRGHPVDVVWTPPGMNQFTQAAATHAGMTRKNQGGKNAAHQ